MSASPAPSSARDPRAFLAFLGLPMIGLLALELLLGMALNLFTTLPTGGPGAILASSPVLIVHILIGVLLVGITGRALVVSFRVGERSTLLASALGLVSVLVAFLAGVSFTFGDQSASASYAMSAGFTGAFVSAGMLLWSGRSHPRPPVPASVADPASPEGRRSP
jgi:hypothetical protein